MPCSRKASRQSRLQLPPSRSFIPAHCGEGLPGQAVRYVCRSAPVLRRHHRTFTGRTAEPELGPASDRRQPRWRSRRARFRVRCKGSADGYTLLQCNIGSNAIPSRCTPGFPTIR